MRPVGRNFAVCSALLPTTPVGPHAKFFWNVNSFTLDRLVENYLSRAGSLRAVCEGNPNVEPTCSTASDH